MASYTTKVKRDIARWVDAGLVDGATGDRLSADIDRRGAGRVSFGNVLAMMAAALFGAAILILIAANWEDIPRIVRVGMLFVIMAAGYVGGAMLHLRGRSGFGEAAYVIGGTAFGATIALIGQMYHMSGDEKQAILVWCAGAAFAAIVLKSNALSVGAVLLAAAWMTMHAFEHWTMRQLPLSYLGLAAILYALCFWTRSFAGRHLLLASLWLFGFLCYWKFETLLVPVVVVLAACALFVAGKMMPEGAVRYAGLGNGVAVQALIGFLSGIGVIQLTQSNEGGFFVPTVVAFAGIITAMLLEGRENTVLRWLAYAAFIFQLGFVYIVMLGTMLGTAGFFVFGGFIFAGLAWLITRIERRFSQPDDTPPIEGAPA
jgi:uncharacterized membrane protein